MELREKFLREVCGFKNFEILPLKQDASSRKYWRIKTNEGTFVLMDGDAKQNRYFEFIELSRLFNAAGIHAPEVFYTDMENGLVLLEDLGDGTFTKLLDLGGDEAKLYELATKLLVKLVNIKDRPAFIKELSADRIVSDICFFADWYYPLATGRPLEKEKREEFVRIATKLTPLAYHVPSSYLLWDYHVDNVMLLDDDETCAVIDFQDAMWGPVTYDIMSLVEDARREVSLEVYKNMKDLFFAGLKDVKREDFEDSFNFLAMFRHMRVLGRFSILMACVGKDAYVKHVPHLWNMLNRALENPKLQEMKNWVDKNFNVKERVLPVRKPITKAMILAAGRGTRMRELGDELPKPLITVNEKPMIDYKIEMLQSLNIKDVVVNVCYQRDKIINHLKKYDSKLNIMISEEEEALETGGGIKKALPLLGEYPFFSMNSDTLWKEEDFKPVMWQMIDKWEDNKYDIMLLINPMSKTFEKGRGYGDYKVVDKDYLIRNVEKIDQKGFDYLFSGIALIHPRVFKDSPDGKFSMLKLYDIAEKNRRLGYVINNNELYHVGTPEDKQFAEENFNRLYQLTS